MFFEYSDCSRFVGGRRTSIHVRLQNHPEIEVVSIFTLGCSVSLPWADFWAPSGHFRILLGRFGTPKVPQEPPKNNPRAPEEHPKSTS